MVQVKMIDLEELSGFDLNDAATELGTERRDLETDPEMRKRLRQRVSRFAQKHPSVFDLVHIAEQCIIHDTPVGVDYGLIRREVGLGLLFRNRADKFRDRLVNAARAALRCL